MWAHQGYIEGGSARLEAPLFHLGVALALSSIPLIIGALQDGSRGLQYCPKPAQEGPKTAQDASKTAQEAPKTAPRGCPDGGPERTFRALSPERLPGGPKRLQEAPKRPQEAPQKPPGSPKRPPRRSQVASKSLSVHIEQPAYVKRPHRGTQEAPKRLPRGPQTAPQRPPRALRRDPKKHPCGL